MKKETSKNEKPCTLHSVVCSSDLRNYFAGLAMQALINKENLKGGMTDYVIIARHAYCAADAMIKEM